MAEKMELISFSEALDVSRRYSTRHLLLGNGFSISCRPTIFVYGKLLERANFASFSGQAQKAFAILGTQDFERVIKVLADSSRVLEAYGAPDVLREQLAKDASQLKEILVQTLASSHPARPADISDEEYSRCRQFLTGFGNIYTLNYDLLLYWAFMNRDQQTLVSDDGFRKPQDDFESSYVTWEASQSHDQNIWYLHGALHVFDSGTEVRKFTWKNTGVALIDQIRDALRRNYFPLFVAEGTSDEKLERIRHSDYLAKAQRSFQSIKGALFIFGHSLAPNDEHILKEIERGKLSHVFIGVHGNPDTEANKKLIARGQRLALNRSGKNPLQCSFYISDTAFVWHEAEVELMK